MKKSMTYICIFLTIFLFNIIEVNAVAKTFTCIYYDTASNSETIALIQNENAGILVLSNTKTNASYTDSDWIKELGRTQFHSVIAGSSNSNYLGGQGLEGYQNCPDSVTRKDGVFNFYGGNDANNGKLKIQKNESGSNKIKNYKDPTEAKKGNWTEGASCSSVEDEDKWLSDVVSPYVGGCLYQREVFGCHVIQFNMAAGDGNTTWIDNESQVHGSRFITSFNVDKNVFSSSAIANNFGGECPAFIVVDRTVVSAVDRDDGVTPRYVTLNITLEEQGVTKLKYTLVGTKGNNIVTGDSLSLDPDVNLGFVQNDITSCEQLFSEGEDLLKMIKSIITVVKTLIPIGLIGLGIVDFASATFAGNEDKMKKAQTKFIKRLIIGVAIFVIPSVLKLLLTIASGIWSNIDPSLCGII